MSATHSRPSGHSDEALLHRLGYNDLMPRTTHPDTDPAERAAFKKSCPSVWISSKRPTPTSV